jgi:hypothetical protein
MIESKHTNQDQIQISSNKRIIPSNHQTPSTILSTSKHLKIKDEEDLDSMIKSHGLLDRSVHSMKMRFLSFVGSLCSSIDGQHFHRQVYNLQLSSR